MFFIWGLVFYMLLGWLLPIQTMPFVFAILGIVGCVELYKAIGFKGIAYSILVLLVLFILIVIA